MSAVMVPYVDGKQPVRPASGLTGAPGARGRSVVVATLDGPLGRALACELGALRWTVREAGSAATIFALLEQETAAVVLLDSWLPDLEMLECVRELGRQFPALDVLTTDGSDIGAAPARGPYRGEVLHALRQAEKMLQQDNGTSRGEGTDAPAWQDALPAREILRRHLQPEAAAGLGGTRRAAALPDLLLNEDSTSGPNSVPFSSSSSTAAVPATVAVGQPADALLPEFVGCDARLVEMSRRIRLVAHRRTAVLVHGPTGTGKELVARAIHRLSGRERFIAINCAAIPEALIEAELFGHARGAFTGATQAKPGRFELAHGGTLLLDEIGEMPLHLQPKLLRALQEREFERLGETRTVKVDIRVIATSNVALARAVDRGAFRSDLYYRLNVIPLSLPPLRERTEDVGLLALFFARTWAERAQRPIPVLTEDFLESLRARSWPGNVRELGNFMQRVLSLHASAHVPAQPIDRACFLRESGPALARKAPEPALPLAGATEPQPFASPVGVPIRELERLHLEKTLVMTQGNRTHAAEMLGISLRTMRNRIREYGLPPRQYA